MTSVTEEQATVGAAAPAEEQEAAKKSHDAPRIRDKSKSASFSSCNSSASSSSSQDAQATERFTISRKALTGAGVHSSHKITGTSVIRSLRAALIRKRPSTTSPSLRASTGILNPNSRIEEHMRSTTASFLRGLRA